MKTLLRFALAGAVAYVVAKWARQWLEEDDAGLPTLNPVPGSQASNESKAYEPDAGEPLRGEDLRVEPGSTH